MLALCCELTGINKNSAKHGIHIAITYYKVTYIFSLPNSRNGLCYATVLFIGLLIFYTAKRPSISRIPGRTYAELAPLGRPFQHFHPPSLIFTGGQKVKKIGFDCRNHSPLSRHNFETSNFCEIYKLYQYVR